MQQLYNEFGENYDAIISASVDTAAEVSFLLAVFKKYGVHSVVDLGCGTGRHSVPLAENGLRVLGVDNSQTLLDIASRKSNTPNVQFLLEDVAQLKLTETYDGAICMWSTFAELPYADMLSRIKTIIKPGGILLIDNKYYPASNSYAADEFSNQVKLKNGATWNIHISDSFSNQQRIRDITYQTESETLKDTISIDILTKQDFDEIMDSFGFTISHVYYDYLPTEASDAQRIQLVYVNHNGAAPTNTMPDQVR